MSLHQSINSRLKTAERQKPPGWKPKSGTSGDALDKWIAAQIGDPQRNGSETASEHGYALLYAYTDVLAVAGKITGELSQEHGHPEKWPIASKAARLAMRDLATQLRGGADVTPPRYNPDCLPESRERFDIDALAELVKRAGFRESWNPWEVWRDDVGVLDTLRALGVPRDWKPA